MWVTDKQDFPRFIRHLRSIYLTTQQLDTSKFKLIPSEYTK